MKKIFALVLALVMALSLTTVAWGASGTISGTGTEADPYLIEDLADLKAFRTAVNGGTTYAGEYVKLTANIDLNNEAWTPIGQVTFNRAGDGSYVVNSSFKGIFDGQNYTISNLKIADSAANGVGLFGAIVGGATVKNIKVHNVDIVADGTAGAVVGYCCDYSKTSTVENCHVSGNISIVTDWAYVGGVVGYGHANISNCSVIADGTGVLTSENRNAVGGIMGWNYGAYVKDCQVKNLNMTGWANIGGVEGYVGAGHTISGCAVENVTMTKTRVDGLGSIGMVAGGWSYNAQKPITITNNTFKNITLTGNAGANTATSYLYGAEYGGGSTTNVALNTNTEVSITNNLVPTVTNESTLTAAAKMGGSYLLVADVELANQAVIESEITIDLNGKTITANAGVLNKGTLTIKDSSNPSTGKLVGSISNEGTVSITGGTFSTDVSAYVPDGYTYDSATGKVSAPAPAPQPPVYYPPYIPPVAEDTKVDSAQTFDAGIALYVGVSVLGAVGTVSLSKKRED